MNYILPNFIISPLSIAKPFCKPYFDLIALTIKYGSQKLFSTLPVELFYGTPIVNIVY